MAPLRRRTPRDKKPPDTRQVAAIVEKHPNWRGPPDFGLCNLAEISPPSSSANAADRRSWRLERSFHLGEIRWGDPGTVPSLSYFCPVSVSVPSVPLCAPPPLRTFPHPPRRAHRMTDSLPSPMRSPLFVRLTDRPSTQCSSLLGPHIMKRLPPRVPPRPIVHPHKDTSAERPNARARQSRVALKSSRPL